MSDGSKFQVCKAMTKNACPANAVCVLGTNSTRTSMTADVKQELEVIVGKFQVTLSAAQQWKF